MDNGRDRATGWKHAKLSGHENEAKVEHMFEDRDFCSEFSARLGVGEIKRASVGGLCETDVECVLGGHTKSKTDLVLELADDWADYVWYVNYLGEDDFDVIFSISDIREAISSHLDMVVPGKGTGGSTILMPFGFVQWHQEKMQFHHSLDALCEIVENKR